LSFDIKTSALTIFRLSYIEQVFTTGLSRSASPLFITNFEIGGKHIYFNIVDKATLLDPQTHPENHRDLIVRVAGYSAYFPDSNKVIQDEIIMRTEHQTA
jgi:autonomous glycyl radical cofactor GrcA